MKNLTFALIILSIGCQPSSPSNPNLSKETGYVDVEGGKVWYGIIGEGAKTPYLVLHGGPGGSSKGNLPLAEIAKDRPVILMDQLGSGFSTFHEDSTLLTIEKFAEQVQAVKEALNLNEFYLCGRSWGTLLALEYYLKYPQGIKGIAFCSPIFSASTWLKDADTLIMSLPDSIQQAIAFAEQNKSFASPSFRAATRAFNKQYFRRTNKPSVITAFNIFGSPYDTMKQGFNSYIYNYMWGPSEFNAYGKLRDYENIQSLEKISTPVLFMTGEFDIARPSTVKKFASLIPKSDFVVIPDAAHQITADNPSEVIKALRKFADKVDME